jgi:hypothetical protein
MQLQDGVYDRKPWVAPPEAAYPPQEYIGPFASNQERLLSQALAVATMPGADVQTVVRPNLPQIQLFPPRYGYVKTAYGIEDIMDVTARTYERTDYAQQPNTQESTSRNSLGWGV